MDIRSAQYLVTVVEQGSVTAAADVLRISQPSLSQAIRGLERTLGTTLLKRTARGVTPTPVGLAVVASARKLLADVLRAEDAVTAVIELRKGELSLAVQSDLAIDPIARLTGRLHAVAPEITFSTLAAATPQEVRALVRDGSCELGFVERSTSSGTSDALREIMLDAQETVLSIPAGLASGLADPVPLESVKDLPMIVEAVTTGHVYLVGRAVKLENVVVEVTDRLAVREMVSQGVGMALLPRSIAEQDSPASIARSLHPPVTRETILVHRDGALSPAGAAFVDQVTSAR
ncbi:LysR family transcriptional regulator [Rhodococcus sp. ARC_M6]|uniref:LysR family transcriptional regulator n=1 Tax=Rhodococcus sp. ARC_M6 TaxID=2928852 RepID=UPI001FB325F9|nr:LysR family transcriptional regulator [Rhodococcus sp. ARC_M6]MCJ0905400.1 LysR family transcriptional regulator [Rhodococcus sp. ARC_M6]